MSLEVFIKKKIGRFRLHTDFVSDSGCLGILGPSGCGKSMTLKCIAGIVTPDEGRIILNGRVLFVSASKINLRPQERGVGYLFQNYALFPNMTVWQNIGCGIKSSKSERDKSVGELVRQFELDALEQHYPSELSGGQQQRVALARMLARRPELVLLDEPFSALDAHLREQMQMRIQELLSGFGHAVMVTHSRDEVYKLCDALLLMDAGRSLIQGNTKEIFRNPQRVQAARLTGCKNISPIKRVAEREIIAIDWGIRLSTAEPVPDWADHVGIRAHDFIPVNCPGGVGENVIPIRVIERLEDPFEWTVVFAGAGEGCAGEIWWKYSKRLNYEVPGYLALPHGSLLLLEGGNINKNTQ